MLPQRDRRDLGVDLFLDLAHFVPYGHRLFSSVCSGADGGVEADLFSVRGRPKERAHGSEPLPVLTKPCLFAPEDEVPGNNRDALPRGDTGEETHRVLHQIVAATQIPAPDF